MNNFGPSIGALRPPTVKMPTLKVPRVGAMSTPKMSYVKAPKVTAPKLTSVHVTPVSNGIKVQHNMTHGPKQVPFVFSDPRKAANHLKRIENSAWRMPDRNEGTSIDKALNLQGGTGSSTW